MMPPLASDSMPYRALPRDDWGAIEKAMCFTIDLDRRLAVERAVLEQGRP